VGTQAEIHVTIRPANACDNGMDERTGTIESYNPSGKLDVPKGAQPRDRKTVVRRESRRRQRTNRINDAVDEAKQA